VRWEFVALNVSAICRADSADVFKRYPNPKPTSLLQPINGFAAKSRQELTLPHRPKNGIRSRQDVIESDDLGFSVRGMGSCIVVAQNFAPGTTAADIQAVFAPSRSQGLNSCRLVASSPTVIAELVFESTEAAEVVVAKFNNKMVYPT
jgi:hypothetical protein